MKHAKISELAVLWMFIIWYSKKEKNATFWKLDLFSFSGGEDWETPTFLGP
jgi:hypothetical protein